MVRLLKSPTPEEGPLKESRSESKLGGKNANKEAKQSTANPNFIDRFSKSKRNDKAKQSVGDKAKPFVGDKAKQSVGDKVKQDKAKQSVGDKVKQDKAKQSAGDKAKQSVGDKVKQDVEARNPNDVDNNERGGLVDESREDVSPIPEEVQVHSDEKLQVDTKSKQNAIASPSPSKSKKKTSATGKHKHEYTTLTEETNPHIQNSCEKDEKGSKVKGWWKKVKGKGKGKGLQTTKSDVGAKPDSGAKSDVGVQKDGDKSVKAIKPSASRQSKGSEHDNEAAMRESAMAQLEESALKGYTSNESKAKDLDVMECVAESREGVDNEGLDSEGVDSEGLESQGLDSEGLDNEGLDNEGQDSEGRNNEGLDNDGLENEFLDQEIRDDIEIDTREGLEFSGEFFNDEAVDDKDDEDEEGEEIHLRSDSEYEDDQSVPLPESSGQPASTEQIITENQDLLEKNAEGTNVENQNERDPNIVEEETELQRGRLKNGMKKFKKRSKSLVKTKKAGQQEKNPDAQNLAVSVANMPSFEQIIASLDGPDPLVGILQDLNTNTPKQTNIKVSTTPSSQAEKQAKKSSPRKIWSVLGRARYYRNAAERGINMIAEGSAGGGANNLPTDMSLKTMNSDDLMNHAKKAYMYAAEAKRLYMLAQQEAVRVAQQQQGKKLNTDQDGADEPNANQTVEKSVLSDDQKKMDDPNGNKASEETTNEPNEDGTDSDGIGKAAANERVEEVLSDFAGSENFPEDLDQEALDKLLVLSLSNDSGINSLNTAERNEIASNIKNLKLFDEQDLANLILPKSVATAFAKPSSPKNRSPKRKSPKNKVAKKKFLRVRPEDIMVLKNGSAGATNDSFEVTSNTVETSDDSFEVTSNTRRAVHENIDPSNNADGDTKDSYAEGTADAIKAKTGKRHSFEDANNVAMAADISFEARSYEQKTGCGGLPFVQNQIASDFIEKAKTIMNELPKESGLLRGTSNPPKGSVADSEEGISKDTVDRSESEDTNALNPLPRLLGAKRNEEPSCGEQMMTMGRYLERRGVIMKCNETTFERLSAHCIAICQNDDYSDDSSMEDSDSSFNGRSRPKKSKKNKRRGNSNNRRRSNSKKKKSNKQKATKKKPTKRKSRKSKIEENSSGSDISSYYSSSHDGDAWSGVLGKMESTFAAAFANVSTKS